MRFIISCIIALLFTAGISKAQSADILESYIRQGLENNLALQQKELDLEKSIAALKEANGLFYPSVDFDAQYTLADGGRSIELPVGDLLNPVYSSLNQILKSMGQDGSFSQISNQKVQFLPTNFNDTKLRMVLPLVNTEIYYNHRIKKEMISFTQAETNVFKRELVKEIKIAYLKYLQTVMVIDAFISAKALVTETLRVNEKLAENQMAGNDKRLRIKAELSHIEAQLTKAENDKKSASSYFNFLINQPLQTIVETDSSMLYSQVISIGYIAGNSDSREEIDKIKSAGNVAELNLNMNRFKWMPAISNITDFGYQGFQYRFTGDQRYVMNVIDLKWNLFNGFQNRHRIEQAHIECSYLDKMLSETEHQLELQLLLAQNNLESSEKEENANQSSLSSSLEYYKIVNRQYNEGRKSLLDLIDARNQLTNSNINYSLSHFETLIRLAELERADAGYKF
jgi:outer membrane protein TolC